MLERITNALRADKFLRNNYDKSRVEFCCRTDSVLCRFEDLMNTHLCLTAETKRRLQTHFNVLLAS